jgi:hypothetical protein
MTIQMTGSWSAETRLPHSRDTDFKVNDGSRTELKANSLSRRENEPARDGIHNRQPEHRLGKGGKPSQRPYFY